jgi:hypothetical protein
MDEWYMVEFIGGPLDGPRAVHPTMNSILKVPGNPGWAYFYGSDGNYHWILCSEPVNTTRCAPTCENKPKPRARSSLFWAAIKAVGSAFKRIW